ncbi:hypothetical protein DERP_014618 [Dermatophagoides pteronyssinus]|uniref:Uncharacterized protein n=1 Tax=Dermatophagoides pteronyssinus TaxID=6956 RepID=A0ABQ8IW15_DERPT|nr:hypothetical protein DERP_014618 [Dermatophagoides pteronyssinus]
MNSTKILSTYYSFSKSSTVKAFCNEDVDAILNTLKISFGLTDVVDDDDFVFDISDDCLVAPETGIPNGTFTGLNGGRINIVRGKPPPIINGDKRQRNDFSNIACNVVESIDDFFIKLLSPLSLLSLSLLFINIIKFDGDVCDGGGACGAAKNFNFDIMAKSSAVNLIRYWFWCLR